MQRRILAAAVGAALLVPAVAFAQKSKGDGPDSVVEFYGKVYPEFNNVSSTGATGEGAHVCTICTPAAGENAVLRHNEIESSNSRFGVRGHEKIGSDLRAIFQLETQFLLDQNNTPFAARDSFIGVQSKKWGTVKLGRMDTPFKEYGDDVSFMGVSSGNFTSTSSVYRHIGMGGQANAARFHERRVNAVQYESPDLGPADFKIQWSTNEAKTDVAPKRDPRVLSMGGQVEFGDFAVLAGYEIHWDLFGLSANSPSAMRNTTDPNVRSKDEAMAIAFKWKVGKHTFEIDANRKKYDEPGSTVTGRVSSYKNNAYMFIWEGRWSPQWRTAFHYVHATPGSCARVNAACNTDGLKGEQFSLGVAYHFSRRTYLFLMGQYLKNDYSARFNTTANDDVNPGEDVKQVALGLHTAW